MAVGRLVELAESHGFAVLAAHEASLDEWDVFESGFTAGYGALAGRAPAPTTRRPRRSGALAARQHAAYFGGYRGVMGLAYLQLVAV